MNKFKHDSLITADLFGSCLITIAGKKPTDLTIQQTTKPTVVKPTTHKPTRPTYVPEESSKKCAGNLFVAHDTNCNQYYLCNQGELQLQSCPTGLYWNENHCDWPENTQCHPDGSTTAPIDLTTEKQEPPVEEIDEQLPVVQTTARPSTTGTSVEDENGFKVVCYFTNWAWYR